MFPVTEPLMARGLTVAADRFGDRPALLAGDAAFSYRDLERVSNGVARYLAGLGVGQGQRVGVMLTNRPEFVTTVFALSKLGAAPVMINSSWKAREVRHALDVTDARAAIGDGAAVALLREQAGGRTIVDVDDPALRAAPDVSPLPPVGSADDESVLVFSSGTTGLPKAVRHTHRSMGAATRHWADALGLGAADRFQIATPPSHILGLLNLLAAAEAGATVRLHLRFDLDEILRRISSERMTLEMAVAPIALALANHPALEDFDLSSLRYIMWGATPVTPSVAERVTARTGVRWLCAYGASEVPVIAANPVGERSRWRLDSAGIPPADLTVRVASLDDGRPLEVGQVGEIQVRGPSVMAGYLPEAASADAFADGWYRTGDVGWTEPEGWIHLTDRSKEMIKVKGFQVAPAEIEAVLHGHPDVRDCAVFGIVDEIAGELPVAAVSLVPGSSVSAAHLQQLVANSLASYKQVRHVLIVDEIPRLPSGKVLRRTLRDEWAPRLSGRTEGDN
jgi:long-chain acyl-CoA synthetase